MEGGHAALDEVLALLPSPVALTRGPDHTHEFVNAAYSRLLGGRRLIGLTMRDAFPELAMQRFLHVLDRVYTTGEPFVAEELPLALDRLGDGRIDLGYFFASIKPRRALSGEITGLVCYGYEVTGHVVERNRAEVLAKTLEREKRALERSERRLARLSHANEVLARAGEILAASLEVEQTLARLAELAVPLLADWAAIDLRRDDGTCRRLAAAYVEPAKAALARDLFLTAPHGDAAPRGVARVIQTGEPEMLGDLEDELLGQWIKEPEQLARVRALGLRSFLCVPLKVRGRPVGALSLAAAGSGRRFARDDLSLAEEVARRAAVAIENAWSYREAQEANRLKDEFLATVSHELRTPLNAIAGWTHILLTGKLAPERQRHALEVIARNAELQMQLVSDLLDVSRVISGKLRLAVEVVDLRGVLSSAVESVRPAALARGVELAFELTAEPAEVVGDRDRLQQIVWNLLTNAIKFSRQGGRVEASARRSGSSLVIEVRDWGEGIGPHFLPHVFERFRQADASFARRHGGLGLGLAITRDLVELHGGTIHVASEGAGMGSVFTVRLPAAGERPERVPRVPALASATPLPWLAPGGGAPAARVLVVEDEPDARELVVSLLEQTGAIVMGVASAGEALSALHAFEPTVILSDLGMPGEDGLSLARRVRALPAERGGAVPMVALTAFARAEDRTAALEAGFDAHMAKPVDPDRLVAIVLRLSAEGASAEDPGAVSEVDTRRSPDESCALAAARRQSGAG